MPTTTALAEYTANLHASTDFREKLYKVAQYALKCRPCPRAAALPPHETQQNSLAARCKVKVGLQLYKIQDDLYLLDVRKVDGEVLPFMDVCALLLAELKL